MPHLREAWQISKLVRENCLENHHAAPLRPGPSEGSAFRKTSHVPYSVIRKSKKRYPRTIAATAIARRSALLNRTVPVAP
jgi:hypothetical protein